VQVAFSNYQRAMHAGMVTLIGAEMQNRFMTTGDNGNQAGFY